MVTGTDVPLAFIPSSLYDILPKGWASVASCLARFNFFFSFAGLSEEEAQMAAHRIGGRLSDVQSLLHKVQSGMSIGEAVEEVIK